MRAPIVLATANLDKAGEICEVLAEVWGCDLAMSEIGAEGRTVGFLVVAPEDLADALLALPSLSIAPDVEETGDTLEENARIKAYAVARAVNLPAIADDTGLEVDALGGAPGVFAARYAGPGASYADNVAKLLADLDGVPGEERTARFATVALACFPDGREIAARGEVEGVVTERARGGRGFGYDPVFEPIEGDGRTFAEMTAGEKHALSHRGRAFRALALLLGEV